MEEESLEELQEKLVTYKDQHAQVQTLVEADPSNAELLKLKTDLEEVLKLTEDLVQFKLSQFQDLEQIRKQEDDEPFHVNAACEALYQSVWYPSYVTKKGRNGTFTVSFYGYGNTEELPRSSLRPIECSSPIDSLLVTVGTTLQARYPKDGKWYNAVIDSITDHGVTVKYDGFGNTTEVPVEYLRAAVQKSGNIVAGKGAASSGVLPSKPVIEPLRSIPDTLKILPTDTEAEKERKKKRIKSIKSKNRHTTIDNERNFKQHGWQSFMGKNKGKRVKGSISGMKKSGSIFASPNTVDGRVGVVGSGQGMTEFKDTRKKFKMSNDK